MKTKIDFDNLSKTDFVEAVVNLVWSADRAMPAHFTSNGKRTQSFCVNFYGVDANDEYQMASVAYTEVGECIKPEDNLTQEQYISVVKCGEDLMIASYIVQKLNKPEYVDDVVAGLIEMNQKSWPESFEAPKTFATTSVQKWFRYCQEYGLETAKKITK